MASILEEFLDGSKSIWKRILEAIVLFIEVIAAIVKKESKNDG